MQLIPAQLSAATTAIRAVLPMEYPADAVLRRFFRDNAILGAHDRAFIAETVFGILRHKFYLECLTEITTPRTLLLAYLAKFQGMNLRELTPHISEAEAKWLTKIKSITLESQPLAVQAEFPAWLTEKLQNFMSDTDILELGRSLQQPAALDLRVNTIHAKRDKILETLQQEGIDAEATPYSPIGIRLSGKPAINRHPLFLSGQIEVQDEGSQLLGYLLAPKRGEMVVDFCAGAGGKTLLLGALMNSKGRIYAFDTSEKRLNNLKPRLKRSGLSNLHPQLITNENDIKVKRLAGKIDRVLVDAPCSGLGTLRRNPDLKWRQSLQSIQELRQKQAAILSASSKLLKPGGRLVYATCSFLPEENQEIIEQFLSSHPQFNLLNCAQLFAQQKIPLDTGEFLQLSPQLHSTDGFFAAALAVKKDTPPEEEKQEKAKEEQEEQK
ncbi:MAG: RsmB/NOP family class I SAM-dependent RNA methyltransferase [Coxiellaceae bacterium]|nr:RsmB/NOP family class I SAM-dependent RNA methyltransferase [Coxiellaceae bacterium]MDP1950526.1 RsmB/NOP family class I SAM-dependent RNA methyltransferase [Nitrosomonas sp.]